MEFNPSKCQQLAVTNKRKPIATSYTIHGQQLESTPAAKYLGVTLDTKLSFNSHVDSIVMKANSTGTFLSPNLKRYVLHD